MDHLRRQCCWKLGLRSGMDAEPIRFAGSSRSQDKSSRPLWRLTAEQWNLRDKNLKPAFRQKSLHNHASFTIRSYSEGRGRRSQNHKLFFFYYVILLFLLLLLYLLFHEPGLLGLDVPEWAVLVLCWEKRKRENIRSWTV